MAAMLTTAVTLLVAVLAGIGIPLLLSRRKQNAEANMASVESWKGITKRLDDERQDLQKRLDESDERHNRQIANMEADWERQKGALQKQIDELQAEVDALGRQLAAAIRRGGGTP